MEKGNKIVFSFSIFVSRENSLRGFPFFCFLPKSIYNGIGNTV